jgi:hypothetical protein
MGPKKSSSPWGISRSYMAIIIVILIVFSVAIGTIAAITLSSIQYPSGWEIGTSLNRVSYNEIIAVPDTKLDNQFINGTYVNSRGGYIKIDDVDPSLINSPVYAAHPEYFGSAGIYIDVNSPYPVVRSSYDGNWRITDDGDPYRIYEEQDTTNDEKWYFFNHFVYFFVIDAKTKGVAEAVGNYVWGTCEGLHSITDGTQDHEARVRIFANFGLSPWTVQDGQIYTSGNSSIVVSDVFYGIMSSSVAEVYAGPVDQDRQDDYDYLWEGSAIAHKSYSGASLAMWRDDTSYTGYGDSRGEISEDVVKSVPVTIPKEVVIEVSANLEPGLLVNSGFFAGTWADWTVLDNKVRTVVRVDAVYSAGLLTRAGGQDTAGNDTGYYNPPDDTKTLWEQLTDEIDAFFEKVGNSFSDLLSANLGPLIVIAVIVTGMVIFVVIIKISVSKKKLK